MKEVRKLLQIREKELEKLRKEKEIALQNVPEGTLRVCDHANRTQYYHRIDPKDTRGTYIPSKNHDMIRKLAQKEYDQKVLSAIDKELAVTKKYLSRYPELVAEQAFEMPTEEKMKQEKKSLNKLNDSFKKFVIVKDDIKMEIDEDGLITMGVFEFLLNENSLEVY